MPNRISTIRIGRDKRNGFTLIELLLAIFIFGIVISVVYGAYSSTFHLIHTAEKNMAVSGRARGTLERITEDLSSIVQSESGFFSGEQQENFGTRGDSLSFLSAVHLGLTKEDDYAGYSTIHYFVEQDEETGLLKLYRSGTPVLPGREVADTDVQSYLLCDGLRAVSFSYFNAEGDENGDWQYGGKNDIAGEKSFPVMVTVTLRFADSIESEAFSVFTTSIALLHKEG